MKRGVLEIIVGFVIIFTCCWLVYHVYDIRNEHNFKNHKNSYNVLANFNNIDGIVTGSEVKIGGVKIGKVIQKHIDREHYFITVTMNIAKDIRIPTDSVAAITNTGLLNDKFIDIKPGASEEYMKNNDSFDITRSSINLEDLILKFATRGDSFLKK